MAQSPDIGQNMTGEYAIPEFLIKSFNCYNSRISNNVDKKLDERIRTELKKIEDDVVLTNYDFIVIFSIDD